MIQPVVLKKEKEAGLHAQTTFAGMYFIFFPKKKKTTEAEQNTEHSSYLD
jgi:hypothetical protein